jgi:threonine synthase
MKYTSTRDSSKLYSFEEALCSGYAPDGGLFVPESLPEIDSLTLKEWSKLEYVDLATTVLSLFVDEISREDLRDICQQAFSGFVEQVVPVVQLSEKLYIVELFHGPTFCFKDLGMRVSRSEFVELLCQSATNTILHTRRIHNGNTKPAVVQFSYQYYTTTRHCHSDLGLFASC